MGHWGKFMEEKLIRAEVCLKNYLPKCSFLQPYRFMLVHSWQWCIRTKFSCKHTNIFLFIHRWVPRIKSYLLNLILIGFWFNSLRSEPNQRCTIHALNMLCAQIYMTRDTPITSYIVSWEFCSELWLAHRQVMDFSHSLSSLSLLFLFPKACPWHVELGKDWWQAFSLSCSCGSDRFKLAALYFQSWEVVENEMGETGTSL